MTSILRRLAPWMNLVGIVLLLVGLAWDALLHRVDPTLAEREGIFTLRNPGHLLFFTGVALCVLGVLSFLTNRAFDGSRFSFARFFAFGTLASFIVGLAFLSFVFAASSQSVLATAHPHPSDQSNANAALHEHDLDNLANDQMTHQHLESGPHIKMTAPRQRTSEEVARAEAVVRAARVSLGKYKDYRVALRDGYRIFGANFLVQTEYHFSKNANSIKAAFVFDPTQPTSLLYRKSGDGYDLVGLMYHAPANFTEEQLNNRFPSSIAPWHLHTNICAAPKGQEIAYLQPEPRFGPKGSIASASECQAAGGKFYSTFFGWMIHLYVFE